MARVGVREVSVTGGYARVKLDGKDSPRIHRCWYRNNLNHRNSEKYDLKKGKIGKWYLKYILYITLVLKILILSNLSLEFLNWIKLVLQTTFKIFNGNTCFIHPRSNAFIMWYFSLQTYDFVNLIPKHWKALFGLTKLRIELK